MAVSTEDQERQSINVEFCTNGLMADLGRTFVCVCFCCSCFFLQCHECIGAFGLFNSTSGSAIYASMNSVSMSNEPVRWFQTPVYLFSQILSSIIGKSDMKSEHGLT